MAITEVQIIEPQALAELLDAPPRGLRLVQITAPDTFRQYHLPGALHVAPAELVDGRPPATGVLPALGRLEALFSRLGYRPARRTGSG